MSRITADNPVPWKVPEAKRMGLIDADGILYAAALEGQTTCDGEVLQLLDDEAIYRRCMERVEEQAALLGDCPQVFLCLSDRGSFRKDILPTYKANRKSGSRPIRLDALRAAVVEEGQGYPVYLIEGLEADDVCGIVSTRFQKEGYEVVIVSPDKDLLSIPGLTLTPKGVLSEVTEERADYWHLYQTLIGDTTDNYKGCPGVGPKKAEALLEAVALFKGEDVWDFIVSAFEQQGQSEEEALTQARVARILRASDWDSEKKEVILWHPHS